MTANTSISRRISRHVSDSLEQLRRDNLVFCVTTLVLTPVALFACVAVLFFVAYRAGILEWLPLTLTEAQLLTAPLSWVLLALMIDCFGRTTSGYHSQVRNMARCGAALLIALHLMWTHLPVGFTTHSTSIYGLVLAGLSIGAWLLLAFVYERADLEALGWLAVIDSGPALESPEDEAAIFVLFTLLAQVLGACLESYATILNDTWRWRGVPWQLQKRCERIIVDLARDHRQAALSHLKGLSRAEMACILRILHEASYVRLGGEFRLTDAARIELRLPVATIRSV